MAINKCQLDPNNNGQKQQQPEPPKTQQESYLRAKQRAEDLLSVARMSSDDVFQDAVRKMAYAGELARSVILNPKAAANRSVLMKRVLQWFNDPSDPTVIRNFFKQQQRRGESLIDALPLVSGDLSLDYSRLNLSQSVADLRKGVYDRLRSAGVRNRRQMNEIFVRAVEEGTSKYAPAGTLGKNGQAVAEKLRAQTVEWMRDKGLSDEVIQDIIGLAEGYIAADELALNSARAAGLKIDPLEGVGYFNRVLSPEAQRLIRRQKIDWLEDSINRINTDPTGSVSTSRKTYDFVVEDEVAFADAMGHRMPDESKLSTQRKRIAEQREKMEAYREKLTTPDPKRQEAYEAQRAKVETYQENFNQGRPGHNSRTLEQMRQKLEQLRAKRNFPVNGYNQKGLDQMVEKLDRLERDFHDTLSSAMQQTAEVVDNEGRLIRELLNMKEDKLNRLVDTGVLSKLPMSSHRVYEVLVQRYDFPFNGLAEMMVVDPLEAHRIYTQNLQAGMRDSVMTQGIMRGAVENGWGVKTQVRAQNMDKYGEYVNLGQTLRASGQFKQGQSVIPDGMQVNGLWVHPDVAKSYTAMLDFSTRGDAMNSFVKASHYISQIPLLKQLLRVTKRSMLTSVRFINTNLFGIMVNGWQAGGNMLTYPRDLLNLVGMSWGGRNALELLDDTTPKFHGMTERQFYLELKQRGLLDGVNLMGEGMNISEGIARNWSPTQVWNRARYLGEAIKRGDIGGLGSRMLDGVDGFTADVLAPFLYLTSAMEDAMKFTIAKTVYATGGFEAATRIPAQLFGGAGLRSYDTVDEVVQHINRYFIDYNDGTKVDRAISSTIMPFWNYTSRNLPLQVRYMMRHPGRFMAYYRMYNLMNGEAQQRGEDFPEAGGNEWQMNGMPIYTQTDPDNPYSWISFATESYDPLMETLGLLGKEFNPNTAQEVVETVQGERSRWSDFTSYINQQIFPVWKDLFQATLAESPTDPFTGREFEEEASFLGGLIPVQSIADATGMKAGYVRHLAENYIPYAQRLNRANPGGLFGVSQQTDAYGRIIRDARNSIFGVTRYDRDPLITGDERELPVLLRAARMAGLPAYEVDVVQNVQQAQDFYNRQQREFKMKANEAWEEGDAATTEAEAVASFDRWIIYEAMAQEMETWSARTGQWLTERDQFSGEDRRQITEFRNRIRGRRLRGAPIYDSED